MRFLLQFCATWGYKLVFKPLMFNFSTPDGAHSKMISVSQWASGNRLVRWFIKYSMHYENPMLKQKIARFKETEFINPIGLGAGFDKNAVTATVMEGLGFGYAAFGSTTARYCPGNPKPWFRRLPKAKSMMVYVGLANEGVDEVQKIVSKAHSSSKTLRVGQSFARTNDAFAADDAEGIKDYAYSLAALADKTAYLEANISCPNTFKGEPFNDPERLDALLTELDKIERSQPLTLKMPSDKSWDEFKKLLDVVVKHDVQGVTVSNLRKDRAFKNVDGSDAYIPSDWNGNMSGKPTWALSNDLIARTYLEYGDKLCIIGLGGVFTAEDAYTKIRLGADLVSLVSSLMYEGPAVLPNIKRGLVKLLKRDGFGNISQARGVDAKKYVHGPSAAWHKAKGDSRHKAKG
ncbi:MAG: quinone-dependent dihydroorotate dehydrogenase [Candidatus Ancillula sp.]|jgi:dihydroorotate dehydrogenase (fumarate)|nr:quinone-dependent dihydroorotate dehydrogenase [Candidatus Ancillula sp.]